MRILVPLLLAATTLLFSQDMDQARLARGDDPRWADPAFDDSGWETVGGRPVRLMEDAKENRLWLRLRLTVPATEPSAVVVYRCACEVFLDGVRLGATGNLDLPRPDATGELRVFPIPAALTGRPTVLAIRQYHPPGIEATMGLPGYQRIHVQAVGDIGRTTARLRRLLEYPQVVRWFFLLLALGALLAAAGSQQRDALILGMLAYVLAQGGMTTLMIFAPFPYADNFSWIWLVGMGVIPSVVFVEWQLAGLPVRKNLAAAALAVYLLFRAPWTVGLFFERPASWTPLACTVFLVPSLLALGIVGYAAAKAWNRSGGSLRLLLVAGPATLVFNFVTRLAAQGWAPAFSLPVPGAGFSLNGDSLATLAFTSLATAYVVRNARERRAEEQRLRSEMESAQTVQALLLSQAMPAGVEAVYLPASEVGGDFYQAFDTPEGTLVLVGDVSGKGLKAAMLVAVVVGAVASTKSSSPAAVLARVNRALLGRAGGGFATACCARFERDGTVTLASAGHLAPYCEGREVELEAGLPLGIVAEAEYGETIVRGEQFTFVSDGVVEAASASGELFGFDRTREIATRPAREIAEAARAWGQNDDITVVTVRRTNA